MSSIEDTGTVRYTVKELLARMDGKLDHIVEQMHEKVDVVEFRKLLERVAILETDAASSKQLSTYKKWLLGVTVTVIGLLIAMVAILANAHYG